jgi:ABC-type branched-subunit amino acid transport system substrate-binding protein
MSSSRKAVPIRSATALVALTALLSLAACGGTQEAGASSSGGGGEIKTGQGVDAQSKTITIGNLVPLTTPTSVLGIPATAAYEAYFKSVNDRGGIDGWKVKIETRDTQYNTSVHVQAFNEIKSNVVMVTSTGTPTTQAILPQLTQMKMVAQPYSLATIWGNYPVLAPIGTPAGIQALNQISYQVENNGAKNKKFGVLYQNDDFGQDSAFGYHAAVDALHLKSVAEATYKNGDANFTAQVQQLQQAGAEVIWCGCNVGAIPTIVSTAYSQGYKPIWMHDSLSHSPTQFSSNGKADGTLTAAAQPLADTTWTAPFATAASQLQSTKGWDQLKADTEKYAPEYTDYRQYYLLGYSSARIAAAILKKAIDNKDLTLKGIYDAKNSLGEVDLQGLMPDNVTYNGKVGPPSRTTSIGRDDTTSENFLKVIEPGYVSDAAKKFDISRMPHQ